jgi:GNAT superfamily N-acetyltransferase
VIDPDVRPAVVGDVDELVALERLARHTVRQTRGGARWLDEHAEIGDAWSQAVDERIVLLGEIRADERDAVAVGYLVADLVPGPVSMVRIDQVFVHPDARELGFGDALVADAMRIGRDAGMRLVEAETLPGDRDLKNLYERAGVTARLIVVSRVLDA